MAAFYQEVTASYQNSGRLPPGVSRLTVASMRIDDPDRAEMVDTAPPGQANPFRSYVTKQSDTPETDLVTISRPHHTQAKLYRDLARFGCATRLKLLVSDPNLARFTLRGETDGVETWRHFGTSYVIRA
jgi:hypothetical protein